MIIILANLSNIITHSLVRLTKLESVLDL